MIYADSLGNRGGTGVYTRRLLIGMAESGSSVLAAINGLFLAPSKALRVRAATGLRRIVLENLVLPGRAAGMDPSIVHLPAFAGRGVPGVPMAVTLHDLAFCRDPSWFPPLRSIYYRTFFRKASGEADVVLADSGFTASEGIELLGLDPDRVRVVHLCTQGFDTAAPSIFRDRFGISGRYCVCTCTIEPRKNISNLLDCWELVRSRHPDLLLVVAGRWGWGDRKLRRRLFRQHGVLYTGSLTQDLLGSCVSGAELMVYPSLYEGFGLPPLEAASAGVPSVVTPAGALEEIYGDVATVSGGFDASSIAEAVLEALDSRTPEDVLRDFASSFTPGRMTDSVLDVYREFEL